MNLTKIWERYFIKETLKVFFLFIFCFYGIYVLIDYSSHSSSFHHNHTRFDWQQFFAYYAGEFVNRSEVLVPFAVLLATIRTLTKLNSNNELIALMASGIKISTLLRPFLLLGLFFTFLMYLNNEYMLPMAAKELKYLDDIHTSEKNRSASALMVQHVALEDNSTILYQKYDTARNLFFDAYWIRSADDIYRIKYLYPYTTPPSGHFVDHIIRDEHGKLIAVSEQPFKEFPGIKFNSQTLIESFTQPEDLSISQLWNKLPINRDPNSEKESRLVSTFYRKLALPWLCLLAVIAPAPFCIRFSRQFPFFLVYACCIFGLVSVYLVLDAAHILGKRQVLDPLWATWPPFALFFAIFGYRYYRSSK